jgi:predicted transcriptional regulator
MRPITFTKKQILELLEKNIVMTVDEISSACGCSRNTVYLKLQNYDYITSFNENNRFIALLKNLTFDNNGLCFIKDAKFSRWGDVKSTIIALVDKSQMGYTTGEINQKLKIRTNKQLGELVKTGMIIRRREGRHQYYLSNKPEIKKGQIQKIVQKQKEMQENKVYLSKDIVIQVLTTIINEHDTDPKRLNKLLNKRGIPTNIKLIELIYSTYKIKKN